MVQFIVSFSHQMWIPCGTFTVQQS